MPQRQAFLDIFPDPEAPPTGPALASTAELLPGIDAFAARVAAGEYADDEESYRDRDGWVEEEAAPWVPDAETLFAALGEMFVAGDRGTARAAYERLLALFGVGENDDWSLGLGQLESTDVPETLARYPRCVYETTAVDGRAAAVHRAYLDPPSHRPLTLAEQVPQQVVDLGHLAGVLVTQGTAPAHQDPQDSELLVVDDRSQPGHPGADQGDGVRVNGVGLAALPGGEHPRAGRQLGRDFDDLLALAEQPHGDVAADA